MGNFWLDTEEQMWYRMFVELGNMVRDHVDRNDTDSFSIFDLWQKYPKVRIGCRRLIWIAEKKGYISKYYTDQIMRRKE